MGNRRKTLIQFITDAQKVYGDIDSRIKSGRSLL